jgi:hypothetical protein
LLLPLGAILLRLRDVVPMWDSAVYAGCVMGLGHQQPLLPFARCGLGDPVLAYLIPLWAAFVAGGHRAVSLYVANLLLVGVLLYSILVILKKTTLRDTRTFFSYFLPVALFAYDPLIVTHIFVVTPDLGTTVFSTTCIAAIFSGHFFLAAVLGILTVFSKASALAPFVMLSTVALAYVSYQRIGSFKSKLRYFAIRYILTVLAPLLVFFVTIHVLHIFPSSYTPEHLKRTCWSRPNGVLELFLTLRFSDPSVTNYLFNIFGLNFHWVETLIFFLCIFLGFCRRLVPRYKLGGDSLSSLFICVALSFLLVTTYTTTRCQHFNNPRYILATVPFFHLTFLFSMDFAGLRHRLKTSIIIIVMLLQLLSIGSTVDPISKWFYGTFPFGETSLLAMTSRTSECCGYGRDQTSYNLQHLLLDEVAAKILKGTNAGSASPLVIDEPESFFFLGAETPEHDRCISQFQRSCSKVTPLLISRDISSAKPKSFTYIDFPFVPKDLAARNFDEAYSLEGVNRFSSGRYFIDTYRYKLREIPK